MLNFLYFVPQLLRQDITREKLIATGLGDVLRDRLSNNDLANDGRLAITDVIHGPGWHAGTIVYPLPSTPTEDEADGIGYYPDRQQWRQVPVVGSTSGYWIGWDPQHLPSPEALQRDSLVAGYLEQLGDGQLWECPIILLKQGQVNLPDVWGVQNGKVLSRVKPDWNWAWDLSGEIWEQFVSGRDPDRLLAFGWCAKLLSINYRLGPEEISILGLLGADEAATVLRVAINGPLIEKLRAEQKKTNTPGTDAASSCSPGSAVATPATAPAEPTST